MHDGWIYQGRQSHGWFGHGTGPGKPPTDQTPPPSAAVVEQRIHDLGHTLIAGLPRSKRYHAAAQLSPDDHARLTRLLTAVVRALPLGLSAILRRKESKRLKAAFGSYIINLVLARAARSMILVG